MQAFIVLRFEVGVAPQRFVFGRFLSFLALGGSLLQRCFLLRRLLCPQRIGLRDGQIRLAGFLLFGKGHLLLRRQNGGSLLLRAALVGLVTAPAHARCRQCNHSPFEGRCAPGWRINRTGQALHRSRLHRRVRDWRWRVL